MAQMLRGEAVLEVTTVEQAKNAEEASGCAIVVSELPLVQGAVARMADQSLIKENEDHHINKHNFRVPFVCRCRGLGTMLMRVRPGAALIRIEGDISCSGNIAETVCNVRSLMGDMRVLINMDDDELFLFAKKISAPYDLVAQTKQLGAVGMR
ncbi:hypothetical protein NE237_032729 [Protea cynaroides]|uniref:PdxS/SNZ N-terminal domain-containing protein n=1 Tax=Protea cynaroides TaxID=273540 RepID=A0A9Q0L3N5_9MAGN|nr:hypothetical protein NE237_032729 [Protea cynaroides]